MLLDELFIGARFAAGVPPFLKHPITLDEARRVLAVRLSQRSEDFVRLARRAIYEHRFSPYRELLRLAGCEAGDLEALVRDSGLEGTLQRLYRAGVYLSVEEFKGSRPIVRGSTTLQASPQLLHNPLLRGQVPARTGASRGAGTAVPINFAHIRDRAVDSFLALAARGGTEWLKAHWHVPGGGVLARLLEFSAFGQPVTRWFSQIDPAAAGLHPRYRWSARALHWSSLLAGRPLPRPEYVPLDDPLPIARWIAAARAANQRVHLFTFASSAVRLSRAALAAGLDLAGAELTVTGEPLTAARRATIERSGATASPRYAVTECGAVGFGCLAPDAPDDVHVPTDLHALIQTDAGGVPHSPPRGALLLTSLRPTSPFILLNVSMGDQAELRRRACGCPLERLGWTTHLHDIRSYEKLTTAGMTFYDVNVVRVLDEVLPARFGGGPTDYQLVEDEEVDGCPRLRLLVHPDVGPVDAAQVASALLDALGAGNGPERVMTQLWRESGLLRVERAVPRTTPAGKILHLHQSRVTQAR
jgi:hypothetical protein